MKEERIWHIYTDGTRADIPFGKDEDKLFTWNSLAICAWKNQIRILVATINDTHFHLLCVGEETDTDEFIDKLKKRLLRYFRSLGRREQLIFSADSIEKREDQLSLFMYVYRNCLDFYKKLPGEYPWGAGNLYFSEERHFNEGTLLADLTAREKRYYFRTGYDLPGEWRCDAIGKLLPESFMNYSYAETLFGTVRTFIAFLYKKKEDESLQKQQINQRYLESRRIDDIRRLGDEISMKRFGRHLRKNLFENRLQIAAQMIREGQAGKNASLAKALYLKPEDLKYLL